MKIAWKYTGCSAQSVPSLSKTAMRSDAGAKSGEPSFVTFSTKAMIASLGAVSFHNGNGSGAWAATEETASARALNSERVRAFTVWPFLSNGLKGVEQWTKRARESFLAWNKDSRPLFDPTDPYQLTPIFLK
jgi:hypothetical protein